MEKQKTTVREQWSQKRFSPSAWPRSQPASRWSVGTLPRAQTVGPSATRGPWAPWEFQLPNRNLGLPQSHSVSPPFLMRRVSHLASLELNYFSWWGNKLILLEEKSQLWTPGLPAAEQLALFDWSPAPGLLCAEQNAPWMQPRWLLFKQAFTYTALWQVT